MLFSFLFARAWLCSLLTSESHWVINLLDVFIVSEAPMRNWRLLTYYFMLRLSSTTLFLYCDNWNRNKTGSQANRETDTSHNVYSIYKRNTFLWFEHILHICSFFRCYRCLRLYRITYTDSLKAELMYTAVYFLLTLFVRITLIVKMENYCMASGLADCIPNSASQKSSDPKSRLSSFSDIFSRFISTVGRPHL